MKCQLLFFLGVFIKISSIGSFSEDSDSETIIEGNYPNYTGMFQYAILSLLDTNLQLKQIQNQNTNCYEITLRSTYVRVSCFLLIPEGFLLCKNCGEDSTVLNLIDNSLISDFNLGLSNITFGSKQVIAQDLKNPRGIHFQVIISKKANCARTSGVSLTVLLRSLY